MDIAGLAETIHNHTGATGDELTRETLAFAACLAYAFGLNEAANHFSGRATLYGPAGRVGPQELEPKPLPGWNFGSGTKGVIE